MIQFSHEEMSDFLHQNWGFYISYVTVNFVRSPDYGPGCTVTSCRQSYIRYGAHELEREQRIQAQISISYG